MKSTKTFLKSRVPLLAVVVLAAGILLGVLAPVDVAHSLICAFRPVVRTYYSDATYTVEVGQRGTDCACEPIFWGVTSPYVVSQTLCCNVNTC